MGLHLSVARGDRPLVLLQVQSLLDLAHHRHVRLRHHDVGRSIEAELLEQLLVLGGVDDGGEESGVVGGVNRSVVFVEVHHILELWIQLAAWGRNYEQSLQLFAVK